MGEQKTKILPGPESLLWSFLQVNVTLLPSHFDDRHGVLPISCTAVISSLYENSTELRLPYRKEPIPERGKWCTYIFTAMLIFDTSIHFESV